ncbi:LLM class flavin-dependent oxidoreductase [Streptosporangium lutulentum]
MSEHEEPASGISRREFSILGAAALGGLSHLGAPRQTSPSPNPTPTPDTGQRARVGFVLGHEQFRTPALVSFAERADRAGFTHVWASDHSHPWQDNEGHAMFPWITLALVGDHTSRVTYGTGVTCPLYRHHPSQVAQAFASLGILTPGRVFLGVGTGEALNEQATTGSYGRYPERHDRLIDAITLIRKLWTGERTTYKGDYYRTDQFKLYDVPDKPVPIYVAASGPKSAYLAGRYGDGWVAQTKDIANPQLHAEFSRGARAAAGILTPCRSWWRPGWSPRSGPGRVCGEPVAVHPRRLRRSAVPAQPGHHPADRREALAPVRGVQVVAARHRSRGAHQGAAEDRRRGRHPHGPLRPGRPGARHRLLRPRGSSPRAPLNRSRPAPQTR